MARGLGINAIMAAAFEGTYGTPPGAGFMRMPFVSGSLGEERNLIESNLLGYGREPLDPTYDVANNRGDVTVPVDQRAIGQWLKLLLGVPVTTVGLSASGTVTFSAQPAINSTVTIGGVVITFVASGAAGSQVNIGASVTATVAALQAYLASVGSGSIFNQTYVAALSVLTITAKTPGIAANAVTLAASTPSNATPSSGTLLGGTNVHTFTSGGLTLPSMSAEIGNPDVPSYSTHYGIRGDMMKIGLSRSGLLDAVVTLIAQGETPLAAASAAGALATIPVTRFAQATGSVKQNGVELGNVVDAEISIMNQYDPNEVIRGDGRINDADTGMFGAKGSIKVKYADRSTYDQSRSQLPVALSYGWALGNNSLIFNIPRVFLPQVKRPIEGPKGIQSSYSWESSGALGPSCTVVLSNDQAGAFYA
jgi:Phage tail tube protein